MSSAGHQHQLGPLAGDAERRDVVLHLVAERRVERHRDPQHPELLAQPSAVRVQALTADQLAADG